MKPSTTFFIVLFMVCVITDVSYAQVLCLANSNTDKISCHDATIQCPDEPTYEAFESCYKQKASSGCKVPQITRL